jgi:hypothetical protein
MRKVKDCPATEPLVRLMLGSGFLFLDQIVDHPWHAAAAEAAGELVIGFAFWVTHESLVKGLFSADIIVVVKCQFAALAAL